MIAFIIAYIIVNLYLYRYFIAIIRYCIDTISILLIRCCIDTVSVQYRLSIGAPARYWCPRGRRGWPDVAIQYTVCVNTVSILYRNSIDTVSILYRYCIDILSVSYLCHVDFITIYHRSMVFKAMVI